MTKFCVFCGEKPISKNKEHIIPKWLIRMTGDPNRELNLGIDFNHLLDQNDVKRRKFSWINFQFPACEDCNSEFAAMESRVNQYFLRIFDKDYFNKYEIDDLLDWFDKVRIGLWLGSIMLDKNVDLVEPKFHIKKRMAHRDRCLFIYELKDSNWKGIQFIGFNSPGFQFVPSTFALRVNNIYFFNYSFDFLFAKNIGFPYPIVFANSDTEHRGTVVEFAKGLEKINTPLINFKFLKAATYLYQPIIPKEILNTEIESEFYMIDYVRNNLLDKKGKKGDIFFHDKGIKRLEDDVEIQLYSGLQNLDLTTFPDKIAEQTLSIQELLLKIKPQDHLLPKERKEILNQNRLAILHRHKMFIKVGKIIAEKNKV